MKTDHTFKAVINSSGGGAWVDVPFDVEKAFGKKRVPVRATIDGVPYRGSLVRMGGDCHMLIILKAIREKIGKQTGDKVSVTLREDKAARTVTVPGDVRKTLGAKPRAKAFFDRLAYSHQREYIEWIKGAKQPETRKRRITKMLDLLVRGKKERHPG
jgi:bifunctional DNA-binding transcriptional regulator/antitoxin component of YhaV-PrlF toxin-antitoxin module